MYPGHCPGHGKSPRTLQWVPTMAEHFGLCAADSSSVNEAPQGFVMGTMAHHSRLCATDSSSVNDGPRDFAMGTMAERSEAPGNHPT